MTAKEGYVWFLPLWFIDDWYDTDNYNLVSGKEPVPCNTSEMIQVGSLVFNRVRAYQ
jgi:hypothetical protein